MPSSGSHLCRNGLAGLGAPPNGLREPRSNIKPILFSRPPHLFVVRREIYRSGAMLSQLEVLAMIDLNGARVFRQNCHSSAIVFMLVLIAVWNSALTVEGRETQTGDGGGGGGGGGDGFGA